MRDNHQIIFSNMFTIYKATGRACCIEKGVPQDCLGLCVSYDQASLPVLPKVSSLFGAKVHSGFNLCEAYGPTARACQRETDQGKLLDTNHSNSSSFIPLVS